jgi:hypothetical protein
VTSTPISVSIARIVGPVLVALGVTEALNIDVFAGIAPSVVYLNGTILFVAGVAILQAHNRWSAGWPVLVTLVGWVLVLGGLYRMIAPTAPQLSRGPVTYGVLATLTAMGVFLTYKAYGPRKASDPIA